MIKPSCIPAHRVTECLNKVRNKKYSISRRIVLIPFYRLTTKTSSSTKTQGTEIDKRKAELYSEQGNTELIVIDNSVKVRKTTQRKRLEVQVGQAQRQVATFAVQRQSEVASL